MKAVTKKGELDGILVMDGRQGMDGTGWGGMHGKGHVCHGLHLTYMVGKGQSVER